MLTWYFYIAQLLDIIQRYIYKQLGSTKTKQASHILQYITHLHQHTWSIHNSYVSKMYRQNIANIFAGFWIRACWILREIREKLCAANISTFTVVLALAVRVIVAEANVMWPFFSTLAVNHSILNIQACDERLYETHDLQKT